MAKSKKGFGTYSNDGLGSTIKGLSDEDLAKARNIVNSDLELIKEDIKNQINRLEGYLKLKGYAIPKIEEFTIWYFDKKKIKETGKLIPKITDVQMAEYISEYNESLSAIFKPLTIKSESKSIKSTKSIKWIASELKLNRLYNELQLLNFVSSRTTFEDFKFNFSGNDLDLINKKIIWLKIGKNKKPNKKSISDFINVLVNHNYVERIPAYTTKILGSIFTSIDADLIFHQSNLAKNDDTFSEFRMDFEKIINSL